MLDKTENEAKKRSFTINLRWLTERCLNAVKSETVLVAAAAAAAASAYFAHPSIKDCIGYMDLSVLALLFCLMAVVSGVEKKGVFHLIGHRLLQRAATIRGLSLVLVLLCFFSSMLITNDVALLTFVPLAILVLSHAKLEQHLIFVIVMQTVAANLGSMLIPIGNPQNLYLYTYFEMEFADFLTVTAPTAGLALFGVCAAVMLLPEKPLVSEDREKAAQCAGRGKARLSMECDWLLLAYGLLLLLCMGTVFRLIAYQVTFVLTVTVLLLMDRSTLKRIDYGLLLTFAAFFIFVGNIKQIPLLYGYVQQLIQGQELLASVAVSQVISNVPAAVLLSGFTLDGRSLILGTNLGGLGTLAASLASLISFKLYIKTENAEPMRYIAVFTMVNVVFLLGLLAFVQR